MKKLNRTDIVIFRHFLIGIAIFCSPIAAAPDPLFSYKGKEWFYRDFADHGDYERFQDFVSASLAQFPDKAVQNYLVLTIPTGIVGRATGATSGGEVVQALKNSFMAGFIVSQGIDNLIERYGLDERFPFLITQYQRAIFLNAEAKSKFYKAFEMASSETDDYVSFRNQFSRYVSNLDLTFPSEIFWEIYHSPSGEVLRLRNFLLPYLDQGGRASRWLVDLGKTELLLALLQAWISEDHDVFVSRIIEEESFYKVVRVDFTEKRNGDVKERMSLLEAITEEVGLNALSPDVFRDLPEVDKSEWKYMRGIEIKDINGGSNFFESISGFASKWIEMPTGNSMIFLMEGESGFVDEGFVDSLEVYGNLRSEVWTRLLTPLVVDVFNEVEFYVDVAEWNPKSLSNILRPGVIRSSIRGVPTGWDWIKPVPGELVKDVIGRSRDDER